MVLTFRPGGANQLARNARAIGAAFTISVLTLFVAAASATAQEAESSGCVGSRFAINCASRIGPAGDPFVRLVPPPADEAAAKHSLERERRWVDRCRPTIVQDQYGVARYTYALPSCEFGVVGN